MDKNGIGTDSTIHEHIKTIQNRNYAKKKGANFVPTNLGLALVKTYNSMGFYLSNPNSRAHTENMMNQVSKGILDKDEMVNIVLKEMHSIFIQIAENKAKFFEYFKNNLKESSTYIEKTKINHSEYD